MNKAITEGLALMPTTFANGLDVWSSENGTPGSATYETAANAAFVAADADFGGALEILKQTSTTKLRYMGETPMLPGMYLRVTARVKAMSGNLCSVRIAGWAGSSSTAHVNGLVEVGPEVALTAYGEVVEVSAIIGTGARGGVDMPWGLSPILGHFGLDLVGSNGGVVRIDDLVIEDVSDFFLADSLGQIDVRDFGAVGDGVTDSLAAFEAADAAAAGRTVLIAEGVYALSGGITFENHVRFEGTVTMPAGAIFSMRKDFNLTSYIDAFGDEVLAFRKAFQALLNFTDHDSLDLCGRRIEVTEPFDMQEVVGNKTSYEVRRVVRNGQFNVQTSSAWDDTVVTSSATYSVASPEQLTNVANIANIPVGARISGAGVGREVYVKAVNVGAGSLTLSQPFYGAASTQTYTFTRYKYVLDFTGFSKLSQFQLSDVEFLLNGRASAIAMAPAGETFHVKDCHFKKPKDRGITSIGTGCQDLQIDRCHFYSNESNLAATARTSIGFNVNANDSKIRNNRMQHMGHSMILFGNGHLIVGNHCFQGDQLTDSPRKGSIIFTYPNVKSLVTGNYIDNSFIEMTNEHDAAPAFSNEFSFGGLTVTGNIFTANDVAASFSWIVIKPYGAGHFIQGLAVQGNVFKALNGNVDRVERVDESFATLDYWRTRNLVFSGNTFNAINQSTFNPVSLEFTQSTAATSWTLDASAYLPFGGNARTVESVMPEGAIKNASNANVFSHPYVVNNYGTTAKLTQLNWSEPVKGTVNVIIRADKPI
ncbi:glycosyl hydrolase family 28-related protein [Aquimixticola soesokkakensis]|nr:glycosyl hydrolase family 28-related protein [Aquimixticola soesokkakensis]